MPALAMRSTRISQLASRRQLHTNETYQQARNLLSPRRAPISGADCDEQRTFEAELFYQTLECRRVLTAYPLGIRRVRPQPDTIELVVESEDRARRPHAGAGKVDGQWQPGAGARGEVARGEPVEERLEQLGVFAGVGHSRCVRGQDGRGLGELRVTQPVPGRVQPQVAGGRQSFVEFLADA